MTARITRSATLLLWPLAILVLLATPSHAGSRVEWDLTLAPGGEFHLDTDVGQVEVRGRSGSGARVVITSRDSDIEDRFDTSYSEDAGRVEVRVEKRNRGHKRWRRGSQLRFEIEVPAQTTIDIDTAGGSISVESIDGRARLDTSGGSIRASKIGGELIADTSGGSITIEDVDGDVNADTSGGSIDVESVRGSVRADTSGGSIDVRDVTGDVRADTSGGTITIVDAAGRVNADTSGGGISVSFVPGNASGGSLSTSGGGITVRLDGSIDLDVEASASGGQVISDIPMTVQGRISKSSLNGRIGAGGETLRIRASGGRIRIGPR